VTACRNALSVSPYAIVDIQMLANNKVAVIEWLHIMREHFADVAIWDKAVAQPAMPKNVMNAQFEFLLFFSAKTNPTRAITTASFRGTIRNLYRNLQQRRNRYFRVHAATFPLHLPTWLMTTFDASGSGIIFDPFCGTGTTLIACEESGRTCYCMEKVPEYCRIIIDRWQEQTSGKAERIA
jgi:DNA modification methylase